MQRIVVAALLILALLFPGFMHLVAIHEDSAMAWGIARMATGLIVLWIFLGGSLMYRYRHAARRLVQSIRLGWRLKFVLFCIVLACIEEMVTVGMTNLAPLFGARIGEAYITASTNYFDVVLLHSVIVFVPLFIALMLLLSRYDLSPFAVFLVFGVVGTICEAIFAGRAGAAIGFPMWAFVYGLMVWLPAYSLPPAAQRGARPARWFHALLAVPAVFILAMPMLLPIVYVIEVVLEHPSIHF